MTSVNAAGGATQTNLNIEPMDLQGIEDIDPNLAAHVEDMEQAYQGRMNDLHQQIEDSGDPQRQLELQGEIRELQGEFDDFQADIGNVCSNVQAAIDKENSINNVPLINMGDQLSQRVGAMASDKVNELLDDFQATLSESYAEMGTATVPGDLDIQNPPICPTGPQAAGEISDDPNIMEDINGASAGGGPPDVDAATADGSSVEDMLDLFQNDPDAFQAAMGDMDAEERGAMMMAVQNQLQEINQLFNMMSQFSQVMHDTSSAIIQNLRV